MPIVLGSMSGPTGQLILYSNNTQNNVSLDLTPYMNVQQGEGMDPANPSFTEKVFSHSLLKEGGTLALESLQLRELVFPLRLNATTATLLQQFVQDINQIINTPSATASWQDTGTSQPTYFDLSSGQLDIEYNYREAQMYWVSCKLRLFAQPLGRTIAPRLYASASSVGPLLMISPYASSGALSISASTQNSIAGFGGRQQGASSGVFYWGAPSLAGDAPAVLQLNIAGTASTTLQNLGSLPYTVVSVLPDSNYQPLLDTFTINNFSGFLVSDSTAVSGQYLQPPTVNLGQVSFKPTFAINPAAPYGGAVPQSWAGQHRMFVIARASGHPGAVWSITGPNVTISATATVQPAGWGLYDVGTFSLRASEAVPIQTPITIQWAANASPFTFGGSTAGLDVTAVLMVPENTSWFLNPTQINPSQYISGGNLITGNMLLDDLVGDQFVVPQGNGLRASPPQGLVGVQAERVTTFSRGLVPRPNPNNGLPIISVISVAQPYCASTSYQLGGSQINSQKSIMTAQVSVLERCRYVMY